MHFSFFVFLFRVYFSPFHGLTTLYFSPSPLQLLITIPSAHCPHPSSWFSERLPSIFGLASALALFPPPSAHPIPSPALRPIARSGLWGPVALNLRILSSLALPAFHTHSFPSKSLSGFFPIRPASCSCVVQRSCLCLSLPLQLAWAPILGSSTLSSSNASRALLAAFLGSASWLGAGSKSAAAAPGSPVRAAGERTSLLNAATWAVALRKEGFGGALGQAEARVASGLQLLLSHPWVGEGMARGRWCPCRWVWKRLCGCCAAGISAPRVFWDWIYHCQSPRHQCGVGGKTNVDLGIPRLPPISGWPICSGKRKEKQRLWVVT